MAEEADKVARIFGDALGTPTFLVGRYIVLGAQPFAVFQRAIEEELRE